MKLLRVFILLTAFTALLAYKSPRSYRGNLPTSVQPGARSSTTNLVYNHLNSFYLNKFEGTKDSEIFRVENPNLYNEVNQGFIDSTLIGKPPKYGSKEQFYYPGLVWYADNLLVDETETTNIAWQEFLFYVKRDSSSDYHKTLTLDLAAQPTDNYFTNPIYRFYPVVGVSHYQAIEYCKWRTNILNSQLADEKFKVNVRLPTEQEWEHFASGGVDLNTYPYGTSQYRCRMKIKKKSGKYFKSINQLTQDEKTINKAIKAYNSQEDSIINFNCKQKLPFFMAQDKPHYAFNIPINIYGLYNVLGNVAEMVDEKGVAKGGSYQHELVDCEIADRMIYDKPEKFLGFRSICQVIKQK